VRRRRERAHQGIDQVKIVDIGERAGVAASTVYAIYKSKDGILRALMEQAPVERNT
jgi:AcrR family transcriptional regulator